LLDALHRHRGRTLLRGIILALVVTAVAWAKRTGEPVETVVGDLIQ
jgi:hypothetical protein